LKPRRNPIAKNEARTEMQSRNSNRAATFRDEENIVMFNGSL
jgi:hypothetical protein